MSSEASRFNAYYFGFDATGCEPVDAILQAVASAGKAAHHTQDWPEDAVLPGLNLEGAIQKAANDAAKAFAEREIAPPADATMVDGLEVKAVREIIDLWFSPWGAAKSEMWEDMSGDKPFDPNVALELIRAALAQSGRK